MWMIWELRENKGNQKEAELRKAGNEVNIKGQK